MTKFWTGFLCLLPLERSYVTVAPDVCQMSREFFHDCNITNDYLDVLQRHRKHASTGQKIKPEWLDQLKRRKEMTVDPPLRWRDVDRRKRKMLFSNQEPVRGFLKESLRVSAQNTFQLDDVKGMNFTAVGGYEDIKSELLQSVDFLRAPEKFLKYGVRLPKGLLLEGPPGNGKTLLARALAGQSELAFIATSGAAFAEKYVGVGAQRVRELFDFASKNEPCIIFIDEIDAIGRKRSSGGDNGDTERDQTLNQLLTCIDGFHVHHQMMVMGATNRVDMLDPAVIRPGRFDKIVHVPNPDAVTRKAIITIHARQKPISIPIDDIVTMTSGMSGAQIETLLNEATLYAIRTSSLPVTMLHLDKIRDRVILGHTTQRVILPPDLLRQVAVHEVGHVLMSLLSATHPKPRKVSLDSPGRTSLGYTMFESPEDPVPILLKPDLEERLKVILGGRAAEEVMYGSSVSSGATADLQTAFQLARDMVVQLGMGPRIVYPYQSEKYKLQIDQDINNIIQRAYLFTVHTLVENRHKMELLIDVLLDKRVMTLDEIQDVLAKS